MQLYTLVFRILQHRETKAYSYITFLFIFIDNKTLQAFVSRILQYQGAVVAVIVWQLDLQLPVELVPMTTKVVRLNPVHGEVYSIQH